MAIGGTNAGNGPPPLKDEHEVPKDPRPPRRRAVKLAAALAAVVACLVGAQVVFAAAPEARFTIAPNPAQINQTITFDGGGSSDSDGDALSYAWDLDNDGSFDDGSTASVTGSYSTPGDKIVRLRVSDGGSSDVAAIPVHVNAPPTASITASPNPAFRKQTVTFNGSGSGDSDGSIANFAWDLDGNGSFETDTGATATASASYDTLGTRNVKLQVTDNTGATAVASVNVNIVNSPPTAQIAFAALDQTPGQDFRAPVIGQRVGFASLSTDLETPPDGLTYAWVDASPPPGALFSTARFPAPHPGYPTAGDKLVALRVTDPDGATGDATATVRVNTPPVASFALSPQTPVINEPISFFETANDVDPQTSDALPNVGALVNFEWDFDGDGTYDKTGRQPTFSYASPGTKTVRLRVTDGGGARDVATRTVQVERARPMAAFAFDPRVAAPDQPVAFKSWSSPSDGDHQIVKQEWDFDFDSEFDPTKDKFVADAEGANVKHAFSTPGEKLVALKVTESGGGYDIATHTVVVKAGQGGVLSNELSLLAMTVQISGHTTKRGAKLTLLRVRTQVGAIVKLTCKGRHCPVESKRVEAKRGKVRFKKFERKLGAGTKIIIEGTLDGFIGRRAVFKIRKGKSPKRRDLCIQPGAGRPSRCPG